MILSSISFYGILLGAATFLIIGVCHPIVIHMEYHWGRNSWWVLLVAGLLFAGASLIAAPLASAILGAASFSCFWGILEMFEQEKRVLKGWFPENPRRHAYYEQRRQQRNQR